MCQWGFRWAVSGALVTHRHSYAPPGCRTSQYHWTFISLCVPIERSSWPCIRWCGTAGFQEQGQCFLIGLSLSIHFCLLYCFSLPLHSVDRLVLLGWVGYLDWYGVNHSHSALHHIVDIESSLQVNHKRSKNFALWRWNFTEVIVNANTVIPENLQELIISSISLHWRALF